MRVLLFVGPQLDLLSSSGPPNALSQLPMSNHSNDFHIREKLAVSALMERISTWIVPALVGGLLTLLFNVSGDRAVASQTAIRVDKLEIQVKDIEKDLAAGGPKPLARRVDDLQAQTQEQYREVSKKLDAIQELLLKRH